MSSLAEKLKPEDGPFRELSDHAKYFLDRIAKTTGKYRKLLDDDATKTSMREKLSYLKSHLGRQLTSYLIGVHPKTLDKYMRPGVLPENEETKTLIRETYKITKIIDGKYDSETTKAWLQGTNSLLNEESPAEILHHATSIEDCKLVIIAALSFIEE